MTKEEDPIFEKIKPYLAELADVNKEIQDSSIPYVKDLHDRVNDILKLAEKLF